ncbi:MAG: VOC family protein [Elusimicrobia bacterium]|nr:VOC family protein [Elusimicrobiota bacterium]
MVMPIPEGYRTLTPILVFKDARRALDFYKQAFGAKELLVMPGPGGKGVMHAEIEIGDCRVMLGEEHPGEELRSAETMKGSPVGFYLRVSNVDTAYRRAVNAGAKASELVEEKFWGDRAGQVKDPFGYSWWIGTHVKDVSPEELKKGAEESMRGMASRA